jgi:hypothetical protein
MRIDGGQLSLPWCLVQKAQVLAEVPAIGAQQDRTGQAGNFWKCVFRWLEAGQRQVQLQLAADRFGSMSGGIRIR